MKPILTEARAISLVGMEFFGNPYETRGGWSEGNAIGQLWQRYMEFRRRKPGAIRHAASDGGYEVWVGIEGVTDEVRRSIFVGTEVSTTEGMPFELTAKVLPRTRYAVFTLVGSRIKTDWNRVATEWLPESGLTQAHDYLIEYYDPVRFRGLVDPASEIDFMVPVL